MSTDWLPDWTGETCVIVASGPSARQAPLGLAHGRARFIAINESWRLCPWADLLFASDEAWWDSVEGCPEFRGMKATIHNAAAQRWKLRRFRSSREDRLALHKPGTIGWGGNSGFCALNIAASLGCTRIILVGFDMTADHGMHWHGPHDRAGLSNPTHAKLKRWREAIDDAAKALAVAGIEVVNCSPVSTLTAYPKVTLQEALASV